jgi:hypothetical protein
MSIAKTFLFLALIAFSVAGGFLIGQQSNIAVIAKKQSTKTSKPFELLSKIKVEKIKEIRVWGDDDDKFYGVIREVNESQSNSETNNKLNIYDESGKSLYETKDLEVANIQSVRFLKPDSRQIMFETNGGGTDDFLKILDYKNGKFNEIIDESETQLRGGYFTMPQYRTGNKTAYFNSSQLIVIQQQGGADENPIASVFRTKDNKFHKVGEIRMQELGDFIEKQIAQK